MKSYLGKTLICVLPMLIACGVVGWAVHQYQEGKGGFRLGVDLVGGTILVYQVDPTKPFDSSKLDELAAALKRRIDPNDLYNVTIRPLPGDPPRVEVILPTGGQGKGNLTQEEINKMRGLIAQQGRLEFRILANGQDDSAGIAAAKKWIDEHKAELERANKNGDPPSNIQSSFTVNLPGGASNHTYSWIEIGKNELYSMHLNNDAQKGAYGMDWDRVAEARKKGEALPTTALVRNSVMGGGLLYSREIPESRRKDLPEKDKTKKYEYYLLTREESKDRKVVTGDYLDVGRIRPERDDKGQIAVAFAFNNEGAYLFGDLTTRNRPSSRDENGFKRHLAIILDGQIQSAPTILVPITGGSGQITGNFTQTDADDLVKILRAGALPATLIGTPVAQNTMGPTLGADTIRKGTISVLVAFGAVLIFMAIYYRFAGLVACFALLGNLILTVAFMVVVQAAFTLPGLAGLVLMLGMAVDANILIYERLREERERGASLALALRNGYDRAFPTIIDTHLSSIFTAIVLYMVGNDQLKGFGISLTVGLIISLFTSLYVTRTIFDIWMGNGWLSDNNKIYNLKFLHLFRRPNFDFMSIRYYWFTATILLTIIGGGIFIYRLDKGALNIDFEGGTAYAGRLRKEMSLTQLRDHLEGKTSLPDLSIEQIYIGDNPFGGASRFFNVRTTERNADLVQKEINRLLKDDLETVKMSWITFPDALAKQKQVVKDLGEDVKLDGDAEAHQMALKERVDKLEENLANLQKQNQQESKEDKEHRIALKRLLMLEQRGPEVDREDKRGYLLTFALPDGNEGTASLYRVRTMLQEEVHRLSQEEGAETYMQARNFHVDAFPGEDQVEERYAWLEVTTAKEVPADPAAKVLDTVANEYSTSPQPDRLENFDAQLASNTRQRALVAIVLSWGAILLYLWFRFGSWTFGAAAVMCLIHDLFFTLGMIAGAHYLHVYASGLSGFLLLQDFKIDFAAVAALLTLVGYSTNDTIVVFDRIREVRGKNPALTPQMINDSVNQTLSRTVLASLATWLVVVVLYFFGGEGVHLFAFVMVVGVIVGTYSSIYIASPLLLIFGEGVAKKTGVRQPVPEPTEATA